MGNKWNWGIEFGARKLFTDEFDGFGYEYVIADGRYVKNAAGQRIMNIYVGDHAVDPALAKQVLSPTTKLKDMYYYANIYVSYVFYKVHCPTRR